MNARHCFGASVAVSMVTNGCEWLLNLPLATTSGDYDIRNQVLCVSLSCRERQMDREPAESCQAQQGEGRERDAVEEKKDDPSVCVSLSLLPISSCYLFQ